MARSRAAGASDGIFSVSHGVSLLGVEGALKSITALPTLNTLDAPHREGLLTTFAKAHLAADLSTHFSPSSGEKSRVATQTQFLGELIGWQCVDAPVAPFSAVWQTDPIERLKKERENFGISLLELSEIAAQRMGLAQAFALAGPGSHSSIAAELANAVSVGWHTDETRVLKEQAAEFLGASLDEIDSRLHQLTAGAARSFAEPTAMHAARSLLLGENKVVPEWYVEPTHKLSRSAQVKNTLQHRAARLEDTTPLGRCVKILSAYKTRKSDIHQTFQSLVTSMQDALGFKRVVVCLLNKNRPKLVARFSSERDDIFLTQFIVELQPVNLFTKLMSKEAGLLVTPEKLIAMQQQIPTGIQSLLAQSGFCAMSIFIRERPVGLVLAELADNSKWDGYQAFEQICVEISSALEKNAASPKASAA